MMATEVTLDPIFSPGEVRELFPRNPFIVNSSALYDLSPVDGRFLMHKIELRSEARGATVILNWLEELKGLVPTY